MSRIQKTFQSLHKKGQKALIPFITAGDPSLSATKKLVLDFAKAGADIIELGVPFSDPMADGPVIQAASERALKQGVTLKKILGLVKDVRKQTQVPLLLMGYYNPILAFGLKDFAREAARAGVDAVLIVDVPPEESQEVKQELDQVEIDLIFLVAPTTTEKRMKTIARLGSGFIYYVSLTGVTGAALNKWPSVKRQVGQLRKITKTPIAIGFGISTPKDARAASHLADGIVVGSALIKKMSQFKGASAIKQATTMVRQFKKAVAS
jgi:tryptophan synthase alpha chain